ncbi:hypothetical protein ITP53_22260 [Nonomuraea sp. K274]|uniref:Signal transduction histidine kinase subgroup 3 dimerisation and phosphoacceptor domain-containing protein n=1 Tax=Nonomuraea cypriaca TaxID=1187855 RepID=A0A931AD96_9ACTN|nr:histidine kinase [Nonomuraea cypriaca]MBF8188403.1 hypothetical protein [Nonomuraea cypriaca]
MATRPQKARKLLLLWMDSAMALQAVVFVVVIVQHALNGRIGALQAAVALAGQLGFFGLFPFLLSEAYDARPRPTLKLLIAGVCTAVAMLIVPNHSADMPTWLAASALWLSTAALYLPLIATVCLSVVVVGLVSGYVVLVTGAAWPGVLIPEVFSTVLTIGCMLLWRWIWWAIRDAHDGKEAKARLAVSEERLRFARDLHDLLGHSLSVITLKSELAAKLATKDEARAAAEMAEVRHLAAESLAEVRLAVDGYRTLDLDEELSGVRAALEAAGARCVIDARAEDLSPTARTLLAWAVREGATNVLKHSKAERCTITIDGGVLEMRNDGVNGRSSVPGNGLHGLSERLVTAGGSFSAEPTPTGEFVLRAAVPT